MYLLCRGHRCDDYATPIGTVFIYLRYGGNTFIYNIMIIADKYYNRGVELWFILKTMLQ